MYLSHSPRHTDCDWKKINKAIVVGRLLQSPLHKDLRGAMKRVSLEQDVKGIYESYRMEKISWK